MRAGRNEKTVYQVSSTHIETDTKVVAAMETPKTTTAELFPPPFIDELSRLESGPAWGRKPSAISTSALTTHISDPAIVLDFQRFVKRFELYMNAVLRRHVPDDGGDRARFDTSISPKVSCAYADSERASTARMVLEWQGAREEEPAQTLDGFFRRLHQLYRHGDGTREGLLAPSAFRLRYSRSGRIETAAVSGDSVETRRGVRLPAAREGAGQPAARPHYALTVVVLKRHGKKRKRPREPRRSRGNGESTPLVITKRQRISDVCDGK